MEDVGVDKVLVSNKIRSYEKTINILLVTCIRADTCISILILVTCINYLIKGCFLVY